MVMADPSDLGHGKKRETTFTGRFLSYVYVVGISCPTYNVDWKGMLTLFKVVETKSQYNILFTIMDT